MRITLLLISLILSTHFSDSVASDTFTPWQFNELKQFDTPTLSERLSVSPHSLTFQALFYVYSHFVSPINGEQCQMYPSCSSYCVHAINSHGSIRGLLMTCDRLHRCGHDLKFYTVVFEGDRILYYDVPRKK